MPFTFEGVDGLKPFVTIAVVDPEASDCIVCSSSAAAVFCTGKTIDKSRSVVSGKVQEHLAPLFPEFLNQFNPKDTRFLGTPLDFIVFDGLDEGEVRKVVFVEVKTGKAGLLSRER